MATLSQRVELFRIEQYLATYRPYVALIVGTYGRTIAAQAFHRAVSHHRHVRMGFGMEKQIGLLRFLAGSKMRELTEYEPDTIMGEMSLELPGNLPYLASRILPRLLLIPHIGHEHIDLFGSREMVAHEYLGISHQMSSDSVVVLHTDDKYVLDLKEHIAHPVITYGMHPDADVRLLRAHREGQGIFLECVLHGVHYEEYFPHLISRQHVEGVLAGLAGAHAMGVDARQALEGMKNLTAPHGSFSMQSGMKGATVIDDTADPCPEKLESSLKSLATLKYPGRTFIVLGDMRGLAQHSIRFHEELGRQAAAVAPYCIFVGDAMRHAQAAALKASHKIDTHHFTASADAAAWLPQHIRPGDVIYIAGGNMGDVVDRFKK